MSVPTCLCACSQPVCIKLGCYVGLARVTQMYGTCIAFLAGTSPYIPSYISYAVCVYTVLANSSVICYGNMKYGVHVYSMHACRGVCPAYPMVPAQEDFLLALEALKPDLCITAAYGCILPQRFLQIPPLGTINIHPSLLPKYVRERVKRVGAVVYTGLHVCVCMFVCMCVYIEREDVCVYVCMYVCVCIYI